MPNLKIRMKQPVYYSLGFIYAEYLRLNMIIKIYSYLKSDCSKRFYKWSQFYIVIFISIFFIFSFYYYRILPYAITY